MPALPRIKVNEPTFTRWLDDLKLPADERAKLEQDFKQGGDPQFQAICSVQRKLVQHMQGKPATIPQTR